MSASPSTKDIEAFFKALTKAHKPGEVEEPMNPINELIYSFLLWNTTTTKANVAFRKITSEFSDLNEFRVTQAEDIADLLGVQYPHLEERVARLLAGLKDVYNREHEVNLKSLTTLNKREAKAYLDSLEGIPQYVVNRTFLLGLGGHAFPLDDRLLKFLTAENAIAEDETIDTGASWLERQIRSGDAAPAFIAIEKWAANKRASTSRSTTKKKSKKVTKKSSSKSKSG